MVIKVFVSKCSGNKEMKRQQEYITSVLTARKIAYEEVDISDPNKEEDKMFMRENSPPKGGQAVPLPPQIFNADGYCGDYESFYEAVECNTLLDVLKLNADEMSKVQPPTIGCMVMEQTWAAAGVQ